MSRWHEAGCKAPDVTILDETPCCTHCFALASVTPTIESIAPATLLLNTTPKQRKDCFGSSELGSDDASPRVKRTPYSEINYQEQFRLLKVSSGQHSDPVHYSVEPAFVKDSLRPSYDVLSYARYRGDIDQIEWRPVYIDQFWDIIFVPRDYEQLLKAIRHEKSDRYVWMQCLCVDETDIKEKTYQMILAPQILREASKTLICLGPDPIDEYDLAIDYLKMINSHKSFSAINTPISPKQLMSLTRLLQHDYFTTVEAVREVVLSKNLVIIFKGQAVPWTRQISNHVVTHASAPRWLYGPAFRFHHVEKDTLWLLHEISSYFCRDNRDKIFVTVALFRMDNIAIDYAISTEQLFIDVATYLVRSHFLRETVLTALGRRILSSLPSWVPDWSIANEEISTKSVLEAQEGFEHSKGDDEVWDDARPIEFLSYSDLSLNPTINVDAGSLIVQKAFRLCAVKGVIVGNKTKHTKLRADVGAIGTLIITCLDWTYEPGPDFVFLLPSMTTPVILRYNSTHKSFTLLCACTLAKGLSIDLDDATLPWDEPTLDMNVIRVRKNSQSVLDLMQGFYSDLRGIQEMSADILQQQPSPVPMSALMFQPEALTLDFALLSTTGLLSVESTLREKWQKLDQEFNWIFLDRQALSILQKELDLGIHGPKSGHSTLPSGMEHAASYFRGCGLSLPLSCRWDLCTFLRSHRTRTTESSSVTSQESQYETPILARLRSRLLEIQEWATVSIQLLLLFEFSGRILKESWHNFPGASLTKRWRKIDRYFLKDTDLTQEQEYQHPWNWPDFRDALQLRSRIWVMPMPPKLRYEVNKNLAVQLSLRSLGLDLLHTEQVRIE